MPDHVTSVGLLLILQRVLALLFRTRIAVDSIWPHGHRACMHLLDIFLLESPSNLTMSKLAPPVCFSEPFPVVLGVNFRALATEHFHIVAADSSRTSGHVRLVPILLQKLNGFRRKCQIWACNEWLMPFLVVIFWRR